MKEEALKLAEYIEANGYKEQADLVRRLVEELEELKHDNEELLKSLTAERKQDEPVAWMKIVTDEDGQFRVYEDEEPEWDDSCIPLYATPQTKPLDEIEQGDAVCQEEDGCPTEIAVLKRFWRSHHSKPLRDDNPFARALRNAEALKIQPLSDDEILDELRKVKHTWITTTKTWFEFEKEELLKAIRAIEKRHGIK